MSNVISVAELAETLPRNLQGRVNQELVDKINNLNLDEEFREIYRDNLISYTSVLEGSKWTIDQYFDAVRYVSYKIMGDTNVKAYARTFTKKFTNWKSTGVDDKTISRYVTAYNKSKLVNAVFDQSTIPFHVINQDYRQKALMTQIELMQSAKSEKVRSDAANSVLTHLKPPETSKIELDVTHKEDSRMVDELRKAVQDLTMAQRNAIESGQMSAKDAAHSRLIIDNESGSVVN